MRMRFTKMHGQGNDFVVIDGLSQLVTLTPPLVRALASRHFGIGCDQVLLVERPRDAANDFRYRIWNADGGEVEQCGNGARCFARFVRDQGLTQKDILRVETAAGLIQPRILDSGEVVVDMGAPRFRPSEVPFVATGTGPLFPLEVGGQRVAVCVVSMGNPHAVQFVDDVASAPVTTQGPLIEHHPAFPARVNAGYAQVVSRSHILLRVWERGAGETLACGTGACAAAVAGIRLGRLGPEVRVGTRGGDLRITWAGSVDATAAPWPPVMMQGGTARVFEGEIDLDALQPPEHCPC
jgi:diaminopimelate epimerase